MISHLRVVRSPTLHSEAPTEIPHVAPPKLKFYRIDRPTPSARRPAALCPAARTARPRLVPNDPGLDL